VFFYCTSKINNYYKVGIAESVSHIKKRLTTYRSTYPKATIKLFSELGDPYNIEWSFKNKFRDFRVEKSECYRVKFNIIYKHFLKYQHQSNHLHQYWNYNELFLSEYYFNKQVPDHEYALRERQQREHMFDGFIPVAHFSRSNEQTEKDKFKYKIIYLDINKVDLREYKSKYKKHLKENGYDLVKIVGYSFSSPQRATIDNIIDYMCKRYELSKTELLSKKKTLDIVRARNIIHNLLSEKYKMNLSNIGRHFKQDHTTVLHSIKMKLNKQRYWSEEQTIWQEFQELKEVL